MHEGAPSHFVISESNTRAAIEVVARNSPADGVPQKPEAWLLHAACNGIIEAAGHESGPEKVPEISPTNR
jgi:predicted RNA polymerase sigma factor